MQLIPCLAKGELVEGQALPPAARMRARALGEFKRAHLEGGSFKTDIVGDRGDNDGDLVLLVHVTSGRYTDMGTVRLAQVKPAEHDFVDLASVLLARTCKASREA